eukprot:2265320-Rhodomonas_salina.3
MAVGTGLPSDTIGAVKSKIQSRLVIPAGEQRRMFEGRQLDDGMTLANYDMRHRTTLKVTLDAASNQSGQAATAAPAVASGSRSSRTRARHASNEWSTGQSTLLWLATFWACLQLLLRLEASCFCYFFAQLRARQAQRDARWGAWAQQWDDRVSGSQSSF